MTTHALTVFQRGVLDVGAGLEEPHGLAIKDELNTYFPTEINHGQLYPNLDTLVEDRSFREAVTPERLGAPADD